MPQSQPKITYDRHGTPAVWAEQLPQAYQGIGLLHGRHRPLQALVLGTAARGELAARLLPRHDLLLLDALVHRLDLPARGRAETARLDARTATCLDAYLAGFAAGLRAAGAPWEVRLLLARLPHLDRQAVLSGLILSAYLGLAEGQEHMERAIVDCLCAGGEAAALQDMFTPFLEGWDPGLLKRVDPHVARGFAAHALRVAGGSNAWAVTGARTSSGKPLMCGDPHLQINQLPALFFELRVRLGADYWLGASIPGLPGIAVGRNRHLAWSGTFACADNVDMAVEELDDGMLRRGGQAVAPRRRPVRLGRRGLAAVETVFYESDRGVLQSLPAGRGTTLAVDWAALEGAGEALGAYMALPLATSVAEASTTLAGAHTLSLHWVLADASGTVHYQQAGRIPRRPDSWSGLFAVPAEDPRRWAGFYTGDGLPRAAPEDGMVVSANEARRAPDGGILATLAQPPYRQMRIRTLLAARRDHDVASMQAIQQDLLSLQGRTLAPFLLGALPEGPVKQALASWDGRCAADSVGAHAFALAYRAALEGLQARLGGAWWTRMLARSEIGVWWARGLDRLVQLPESWAGAPGAAMRAALAGVRQDELRPWGEVRQLHLKHFMLGALPDVFGLNRGPYPLAGSIATVAQGNVVPSASGSVVVGPAYRMVCDLAEPGLHTSLPGGIDGSALDASYDCWLQPWRAGTYHRLLPPEPDEAATPP